MNVQCPPPRPLRLKGWRTRENKPPQEGKGKEGGWEEGRDEGYIRLSLYWQKPSISETGKSIKEYFSNPLSHEEEHLEFF